MSEWKKGVKYVSYSQFATYSQCPQKFKLERIDKIGEYESNIHLVFGTAVHETIQNFLEIYYGETKKMAMSIDLHEQLLANMKSNYLIEEKKMNGKAPCTYDEIQEFYDDGCNILTALRNKINKFYPKSGYELIGNEIRLEQKIKNGVYFIGFADVVLYDQIADKIVIIDIKSSTKGWSKYQKMDKVKTSQMLIYKKYYSELFGVPQSKIAVEYHILKRKVGEYNGFPLPRISKFVPANGSISMNKAWDSFNKFVDVVYSSTGEYNKVEYPGNTGRLCDWCSFKTTHCSEFKYLQKDSK